MSCDNRKNKRNSEKHIPQIGGLEKLFLVVKLTTW